MTQAPSFFRKHSFWLFLIAAIILRQLPFVSIPFNWLETYFHEISHGLAALLTGGKIINIQLFPNGSGLCTTQGGWAFFITFMGYTGASLWGALIYSISGVNQRLTVVFSSLLIALLSLSIVLWVRDVFSFIIVGFLLVLFILPFKFKKLHYLSITLKLTGIMVLLNSVFSPTFLFDGRNLGDGATLANSTGIPEFFWVFIWLAIALTTLYLLSKKVNK